MSGKELAKKIMDLMAVGDPGAQVVRIHGLCNEVLTDNVKKKKGP